MREVEIFQAVKKDCPKEQTLPQKLTHLLGENYAEQHSLGDMANFYQMSVLNGGTEVHQLWKKVNAWKSDGNILPEDAFLLCYFHLPIGNEGNTVFHIRKFFHESLNQSFFPDAFRQNKKGVLVHRKLLLREAVLHFGIYIGLSLSDNYALYRRACKCYGRCEKKTSTVDVYEAYRNLLASMSPNDKHAQQTSFCQFCESHADQLKINWTKSVGTFRLSDEFRHRLASDEYCERLVNFLERSPYNRTALDSVTRRVSQWKICKSSRKNFRESSRYSSDISRNELYLLCVYFQLDEKTSKDLITTGYGMNPTHPKRLFELLCDYALSLKWDEYDVYDFYEEYIPQIRDFVQTDHDLTTYWILSEYLDIKEVAKVCNKTEQMNYLHRFLKSHLGDFSAMSKSMKRILDEMFAELGKSIGSLKEISDALAYEVDEFMELAIKVGAEISPYDFGKLSSDGDLLYTMRLLQKYENGQKEIPREHLLWLMLIENKKELSLMMERLECCGFYPLSPRNNAFDWIFCYRFINKK